MTPQEQPAGSEMEQWERITRRVGVGRARLEWVARAVQESHTGWTPGRWDDFCRELAVFSAGPKHIVNGEIERPSQREAQSALQALDTMLTSAVARKPIEIGRRTYEEVLIWNPNAGEYFVASQPEDFDWTVATKERLKRLLQEFGHLVKQCEAPARRSKRGVSSARACSTLFIANRPGQEFCSPRCQARAATRRFREKAKGKSKKKHSTRTRRTR